MVDMNLQNREIKRLADVARWMDSAFRIPGTRITLGLDAVIGLIPVIGDTAGLVIGLWIVSRAHKLGVPTPTLLRMLGNLGIDWALGAVPLAGDFVDIFWKANQRNIALLDKEVGSQLSVACRLPRRAARQASLNSVSRPLSLSGLGPSLLDDLEIFRSHLAAAAFNEFVGNFLPFGQTGKAGLLNGADVDKGILGAVFGLDKPVPFGRVKPFDCTICHDKSFHDSRRAEVQL